LIFNIDKEELYQQTYSLQSIGVHGIRLGKKTTYKTQIQTTRYKCISVLV